MNEKRYLKIAHKVMSDETDLIINIKIKDAWILVAAVQLALHHPNYPANIRVWTAYLTRQFITAISARHPSAREALEMGYDERYDVEVANRSQTSDIDVPMDDDPLHEIPPAEYCVMCGREWGTGLRADGKYYCANCW